MIQVRCPGEYEGIGGICGAAEGEGEGEVCLEDFGERSVVGDECLVRCIGEVATGDR
jgi:hypothetical protein